jgi:hypothetical protein
MASRLLRTAIDNFTGHELLRIRTLSVCGCTENKQHAWKTKVKRKDYLCFGEIDVRVGT